jgi:hypothetical protein
MLDRLSLALQRAAKARPQARIELSIEAFDDKFACFVIDYRQPEGNPRRKLSSSIGETDLAEALDDVIKVLEANTDAYLGNPTR